ncbi:MAG: ACT domain-containing protein [Thermoplasmata archaeon]|nr:MAG: ACT domain-containing protein [Thermoplasmata archaeon]
MKVQQISIFLENKSGRLSEVTRILGDNGINIRALSLADTTDFGILRLIVNDADKANKVLKENGFTVGKTEVIAVEVDDKPGGLASVLEILNKENINVEYMYAFVERSQDNAVIIFRFDDQFIDRAITLLKEAGITVLENEKVYSL